jgi:hypothetical protein
MNGSRLLDVSGWVLVAALHFAAAPASAECGGRDHARWMVHQNLV